MEEALLSPAREERVWRPTIGRGAFAEELKRLSFMAAPMVVVTVSQYLVQVVSLMMVGHLGELSLSGVAIAVSFTNVTGFSLLFGMVGALETLCGQAYGAEQYQQLGIYTYCAIICLTLVCLPVSLLWMFVDKVLALLGQDPSISLEAGKYSIFLIPALFGYAVLQSLVRYLQSQGLIIPMLFTSCATLCFHVPLCWALTFNFKLGIIGAALANGLSYWFNVTMLGLYVRYSSACEKTRITFSKDVFRRITEFFRFAIPSAVMACIEWWSFELLVLLAGLFPNPTIETSVLSICLSTMSLHYYVPYAVGAAASTRVSNELGAGNPQVARLSVSTAMFLGAVEIVTVSTTLFCCRSVWGYAYSDEKEIVDYMKGMTPLLCLSVIMDTSQALLSGVARGSGWQHIGAFVNLGAYYLVGIPGAVVLGFVLHLRGKGLWIGILAGSTVQAVTLALVTTFTNWQKQATKARARIFQGTISAET
ncbi:hypothetical protein I3760_03G058600 [Carya illinoinensis]|nr:hypothetical protein I3760_03G058600 [Carya illinoinensis]